MAKITVCVTQLTGRISVPSLSTMRPELIGFLLRLCNVPSSLATGSRPIFLHPTHHCGENNFPAAQPTEEVPARCTELISLDCCAAQPALLASYLGGLRFNAVLVDVLHCLLAIVHEPLLDSCSTLCCKSSGARAGRRSLQETAGGSSRSKMQTANKIPNRCPSEAFS